VFASFRQIQRHYKRKKIWYPGYQCAVHWAALNRRQRWTAPKRKYVICTGFHENPKEKKDI
jgi:hypothetical protein